MYKGQKTKSDALAGTGVSEISHAIILELFFFFFKVTEDVEKFFFSFEVLPPSTSPPQIFKSSKDLRAVLTSTL